MLKNIIDWVISSRAPTYNSANLIVLEVKPKDFIDEITESKRIATENLGYRFMYITEEDIDFLPLSSLDYDGDVVLYKENVQRLSKADKMKYLISLVE